MATDIDEQVGEFLEHFGVLGMHWGVRNPKNRQLNRESRNKAWEKQKKDVNKAKAKVATGELRDQWKQSKVQFKIDREKLGSREARVIMNKKRMKINETYNKSREAKSRKEATLIILAAVGLTAVSAISAAANNR